MLLILAWMLFSTPLCLESIILLFFTQDLSPGIWKTTKGHQAGKTTNPGDQQPKTIVQQSWIKALHYHKQTLLLWTNMTKVS